MRITTTDLLTVVSEGLSAAIDYLDRVTNQSRLYGPEVSKLRIGGFGLEDIPLGAHLTVHFHGGKRYSRRLPTAEELGDAEDTKGQLTSIVGAWLRELLHTHYECMIHEEAIESGRSVAAKTRTCVLELIALIEAGPHQVEVMIRHLAAEVQIDRYDEGGDRPHICISDLVYL